MSFEDERDRLVDRQAAMSDAYDKAIISLAGGALALSITFADEIAPPSPRAGWALFAGWIVLGLSLLSILFSFLASQKSLLGRVDWLDKYESDPQPYKTTRADRVADTLNIAAALALVAGFGLMAVFAGINLRR